MEGGASGDLVPKEFAPGRIRLSTGDPTVQQIDRLLVSLPVDRYLLTGTAILRILPACRPAGPPE
jgi:hypothetical protein